MVSVLIVRYRIFENASEIMSLSLFVHSAFYNVWVFTQLQNLLQTVSQSNSTLFYLHMGIYTDWLCTKIVFTLPMWYFISLWQTPDLVPCSEYWVAWGRYKLRPYTWSIRSFAQKYFQLHTCVLYFGQVNLMLSYFMLKVKFFFSNFSVHEYEWTSDHKFGCFLA